MSTPNARAIDRIRRVLASLSSALQTYALYPPNHPSRTESLQETIDQVNDLIIEMDEPPVLFVTRHSFYLGSSLLACESLTLSRLIKAFETTEVEAVEFFSGIDVSDIDMLIRILMKEEEPNAHLPGIAVNRVRPMLGRQDERERAISEMLMTYASGVELVRQESARIAAGRDVDLDATRAIVERLADEVARDPRQALLVSTVKSYDDYTYYHMMNVCLLSIALGWAIGLHRDQVILLGIGGLLHDVGKVKVPREILQHAGPLSEEGWRMIQRHPVDGAGMMFVTTRELFHPAASIILEHHSAYDLGGYPALSGRPRPSLPARIVSVADSFDAVTTKRPYRQAEDRRQALEILQASSGTGYDPRVVRAFVRLLGLYPIGSLVQLTSGEIGIVERNHEQLLGRPVIRLMLDAQGTSTEPVELDLAERTKGRFKHNVARSIVPEELGVDMAALVKTYKIDAPEEPLDDEGEAGLHHEPMIGEQEPENYVDTHAEAHTHPHPHPHPDEPIRYDPDVAPPFDDE